MYKTHSQYRAIIFLLFAVLFLGLVYFPIKQVSADKGDTGHIPQLPPEAQPATPQAALAPPTSNQQRLQVSFTSIKINNDHDPQICKFGRCLYQNDGEWKIGVLVNGQFRDLSSPGSPLGDARGGSTYSLTNIQPIVLNVDKSRGALVISTIGQEIDGCNFHYNIPPIMVKAGNAVAAYYTGGKSSTAQDLATGLLGKAGMPSTTTGTNTSATGAGLTALLPSDFNKDPRAVYPMYQYQLELVQAGINKFCSLINKNDAIGKISDTYNPPTFGIGLHSTLSSTRDFILTYQIKPVQQSLQAHLQQPGQFQQQDNPIVRDHRTPTSILPPAPHMPQEQ